MKLYLIPSPLAEDGVDAIPSYVIEAVKDCKVFFVENERTARRYLKQVWKEMVIDEYEWFAIGKNEEEISSAFRQKLKGGKSIGIISEAGCPGIADPGQLLVSIAQEMNVEVKPLVGPSSILLALMASGMNGQQFRFLGYLPINDHERSKAIKDLEDEAYKKNCTQVFIETPYRNDQLLAALLKTCKPVTHICLAVELTGKNEWVKTRTVSEWKKQVPELHKKTVIFCIHSPLTIHHSPS